MNCFSAGLLGEELWHSDRISAVTITCVIPELQATLLMWCCVLTDINFSSIEEDRGPAEDVCHGYV